jgi:hypothetical protein
MRTRVGNVPDSLISLSLLLIFLILMGVSVAGRAQANLHLEARASGCFGSIEAPERAAQSE